MTRKILPELESGAGKASRPRKRFKGTVGRKIVLKHVLGVLLSHCNSYTYILYTPGFFGWESLLRKVITKANQIVCGRKFNIILGNEYKSVKVW